MTLNAPILCVVRYIPTSTKDVAGKTTITDIPDIQVNDDLTIKFAKSCDVVPRHGLKRLVSFIKDGLYDVTDLMTGITSKIDIVLDNYSYMYLDGHDDVHSIALYAIASQTKIVVIIHSGQVFKMIKMTKNENATLTKNYLLYLIECPSPSPLYEGKMIGQPQPVAKVVSMVTGEIHNIYNRESNEIIYVSDDYAYTSKYFANVHGIANYSGSSFENDKYLIVVDERSGNKTLKIYRHDSDVATLTKEIPLTGIRFCYIHQVLDYDHVYQTCDTCQLAAAEAIAEQEALAAVVSLIDEECVAEICISNAQDIAASQEQSQPQSSQATTSTTVQPRFLDKFNAAIAKLSQQVTEGLAKDFGFEIIVVNHHKLVIDKVCAEYNDVTKYEIVRTDAAVTILQNF